VTLEATGVERFAIAGNSMGGWVAWRYALANPEDVTGLILIDASGAPPPPDAEKPKLYLGARIMRHPVGRFLARHITPRSLFEQSLRDAAADEDFVTDDMVDRYWELMRFPGNRRAAGLRAIVDREPEYGQRLAEITVPTLILWGAEDRVTPPDNAMTFDATIPNSRSVVFEGVGHLTMEEAPERTAAAIDGFLDEVPADPTGRNPDPVGPAGRWHTGSARSDPGTHGRFQRSAVDTVLFQLPQPLRVARGGASRDGTGWTRRSDRANPDLPDPGDVSE